MNYRAFLSILLVQALGISCYAQTAAPAPASRIWSALSAPTMDASKSAHVENVEIVRDHVHIILTDGTIQFAQPANGVVFGAVFHGNGRIQADPPNPIEARQLFLFTKQTKLDMPFTDATFSFTDGLLDEVSKQVKWQGTGPAADELYVKRQQEREELGAEYLPRLFKSVMSGDPKRTAYFLAELKTKGKGWVEVRDDFMELEEIRIGRWGDLGPVKLPDIWMNFPSAGRDARHAYDDPAARQDFLIPSYKIATTVADNAELNATTEATVQPRYSGEGVLLFTLDSNLRVSSVKDSHSHSLEFFQARERKDRFQSYGNYVAVVLATPTQAGQNEQFTFQYGGKRVVRKVGNGNYFCESFGWYPSAYTGELGVDVFAFRSDFDLTFRTPKRYGLIATGGKVSQTTDGGQLITAWKSEVPLAAAGFAFGDYKIYTEKAGDVEVQVYANKEPDDLLKSIQQAFDNPLEDLAQGPGGSHTQMAAIGNLTPSALAKTIGIETSNTLRVFQSYFGPYPYKQIAVTNIIGSYGQGWPGLLYLSWVTFLDSTQRNALGIKNQVQLTDFFRGHESSHQWWGHRVGWKSYHDQWLSEGFAEFSGKLYVQFRQNPKESLSQFRRDKELLHTGDIHSHQVDSLGPIWLGRRIQSSETNGSSYQNLIYSKGGYVLQMLRSQLTDLHNPDPEHLFKEMMQDYCKTFDNKPASTEDFKAIVEKHMTRGMDLDGNHKMDWFFNQYVYGTGIPQYSFHVSVEGTPDGKSHIKGEITRAGVPDSWKDVVPLYAHLGDKTLRLGVLGVTHPREPIDVIINGKIDRVSINDYEDLLADVKQ
jgi:Peptidase family M1 domain